MRGYYCKQKGCQNRLLISLSHAADQNDDQRHICGAGGGQKAAHDHARRPRATALPQPQRTNDEPGHSQDKQNSSTPEGHILTTSSHPAGP